ncbi:peptidase, partial [candidate division KSB1 bacterium]|nr:peptidase [candidate division KSB1 bacterium]
PWNRLEEEEPFIFGIEKPKGAGFYPPDMTKEEFTNYVKEHPDQKQALEGTFTVVRRQDGALQAIPYHQAYPTLVESLHQTVMEAAELADEPTLRRYLELRARDLLTDNYFDSDMAWMDLEGNLEIVIGPYEVYEDELFNYKAAYEAFICVVDVKESEKLATVAQYLNDMEAHLPIPDEYKNFNRGSSSPIKVVQEILAAGDTKAGIQTTAFNLPNDERVREAKGSKKVMLKNVAQAKFDKCWIPIVNTILAEEPLSRVSFDAYFNHVLMHEMSHGIGPGNITLADGTQTTVARELSDLYSVIEECKADVLGVYNMIFMIDKGVFPKDMEPSVYASYLGGMFRSIRFGIDSAHGGGVAIQFNTLMEKGAFFLNENDKLGVHPEKIMPALEDLATELLTLQALGDYDRASRLIEKYRVMSPVMQQMIDRLDHLPIDIRPSFPVAKELLDIM